MSSDFAQLVKQQADIVKIIGGYITLKKSGAQNYAGLCPFHGEKTASFSVHAVRQFYHCFGCNESGDVFSFVQKIENVGFPEAVKLALDEAIEEAREMRREQASRIVVPDAGGMGAGPVGGGKIKFP